MRRLLSLTFTAALLLGGTVACSSDKKTADTTVAADTTAAADTSVAEDTVAADETGATTDDTVADDTVAADDTSAQAEDTAAADTVAAGNGGGPEVQAFCKQVDTVAAEVKALLANPTGVDAAKVAKDTEALSADTAKLLVSNAADAQAITACAQRLSDAATGK